MPYTNALQTLMSNPQPQVSGGLLGGFSPYPQASVNAAPQAASMTAGMGPWSLMAYQMAGSPKQGGAYAPVTPPPTPVNTNAAGSSGGSSVGSIATGLLGSVLKNPSLIKSAYNGITGLLGGGSAIPASVAAEGASAAGAANAAAGAYAAGGLSNLSVLPSVTSAIDAGAAGGAAGGAATGAANAGAGAAAGSLGGALAGGAILAAPLIAGLLTKPVQVNQAYYTKAMGNLTSSDPSVRIPAISEALAQKDILQHVQQDNPDLYQQLVSGQAMRDALNAYSSKQLGGAATQKGAARP